MSGRLRDRDMERLIEGELARDGAALLGYEHKGSGNREVHFKVAGLKGRYVFPRHAQSCSRVPQNVVHSLRRVIRELKEKAASRKADRAAGR